MGWTNRIRIKTICYSALVMSRVAYDLKEPHQNEQADPNPTHCRQPPATVI